MTQDEIKEFIKKEISKEFGNELFNGDLSYEFFYKKYKQVSNFENFYEILKNNQLIIAAEDKYGGEGKGDEYWKVYSFEHEISKEKVYVEFYGFYQSFNGSEYEDFKFVTPKSKVIIEYV